MCLNVQVHTGTPLHQKTSQVGCHPMSDKFADYRRTNCPTINTCNLGQLRRDQSNLGRFEHSFITHGGGTVA